MKNVNASFDTTTLEGKKKVFNAQNGASVSLKTLDTGKVINVVAILQYQETTDTYGQEQESTITTLFADDGTSYAGISDTVAKAGESLIDFMTDMELQVIPVRVVKARSGKGNEFLNLQIAE